jgi:hypothetical protein
MVRNLEECVANANPVSSFYLPSLSTAYLHHPELPTPLYTEVAADSLSADGVVPVSAFSMEPADPLVASLIHDNLLIPPDASAHPKKANFEQSLIRLLEALSGDEPNQPGNFAAPINSTFFEENRIRPKVKASRWLRGFRRARADFRKDSLPEMRITFIARHGGIPKILRCVVDPQTLNI